MPFLWPFFMGIPTVRHLLHPYRQSSTVIGKLFLQPADMAMSNSSGNNTTHILIAEQIRDVRGYY